MIKYFLLLFTLLSTQVHANLFFEKTNTVQKSIKNQSKIIKKVVLCPSGYKTYILKKEGIFYSDKAKKFLFAKEAAKHSCKKKNLRSKKNAVVCVQKKDMYQYLKYKPTQTKLPGSCVRLHKSIPLKIKNHFPFTLRKTYYEIKYRGKKLYISNDSLYRKATKNTKKYKKTKYKKTKYKKKQYKKKRYKKRAPKHSASKNKVTKINKTIKAQNTYTQVDTQYQDRYTNIPTQRSHPSRTLNQTNYDTDTRKPTYNTTQSLAKKKENQNYTYRCMATYGDKRMHIENDISMLSASNEIWRRCQTIKNPEDECKITDCFKLIK